MSKKNKNFFPDLANKILILGFGSVCLVASLIFQSRAGYIRFAINSYLSVLATFIIGILNAFNLYEYAHACGGKQKETSFGINLFEFLSYILMSCGFFNVVMMPVSGFGLVELVVVMFYLVGGALSQGIKTKKIQFSGKNPMGTYLFGCILLLVKIIFFYVFDDNLYLQFVEGNTVLRGIIFGITVVGAIGLLRNLSKIGEANLGISGGTKRKIKGDVKNLFVKALKAFASGIKKAVVFVLTCFSGWVGILILCIAGLLVFGIGAFVFDKFFESVMRIVEPVLKKLLTTGEYSVNPGMVYTVGQLCAFAIFSVFSWYIVNKGKRDVEKNCDYVLENYVLNDPDLKCIERNDLKEKILLDVSSEKNELKKIAMASDRVELKKIALVYLEDKTV